MQKTILIGSMNGKIYTYNTATRKFDPYDQPDNRGVMGLARDEKHLFVSSRTRIMRQEYPRTNNNTIQRDFPIDSPQFHQLLLHDEKVYITCTAINEIWIFDYNLTLLERKQITPPLHTRQFSYKTNYNHVNSICYHKGLFYVGLNWFTRIQYGRSGVCELDNNLEELRRFEYGWESHGFNFVDNKPYALCAVSGTDKKISHPRRAGLLVDHKLVFEHPTNMFCKAFAVDKDYIYLVGGDVITRNARGDANGIMYILDRNFRLIDTVVFEGVGQLCGVMLA